MQRILEEDSDTNLILACRNVAKAEKARKLLLENYPSASVDIIQLDTGSLTSVYNAAKSIRLG